MSEWNVSKTQFIIFKAKNKKISHNIEIQINKQIIEQVNNTKFLGLIIDKELTWKQHIKLVETKISKMSGILVRTRRYISLRTLKTIYNALIYPYLTYCNILWASTYVTRLKGIYKIQKKILRIMAFSKYRQESRPLFLSLGLLNIYELNFYQIAIFMHSYLHGNLPSVFNDYFFQQMTQFTCIIPDHQENCIINYKRTNYGKFSIKYKGAQTWNSLPTELKDIKSKYIFTRKIKQFFTTRMWFWPGRSVRTNRSCLINNFKDWTMLLHFHVIKPPLLVNYWKTL